MNFVPVIGVVKFNIMRYIFMLMSLAGLMSLSFGCSDEDRLIPVQIEIRPDTIRLKSTADTSSFAVMINSRYDNIHIAWSARADTNWIKCTPVYSFGSRFVDVMVSPNLGEERIGTITINPRNSDIYLNVIVIQAAHNE